MKKRTFLIFFILFFGVNSAFSQSNEASYTINEQTYSSFFSAFLKEVKTRFFKNSAILMDSSNERREDQLKNDSEKITKMKDTEDIKFLLTKYILALDITGSLNEAEKLKIESEEIGELIDFFQNNKIDNLQIKPLRMDHHFYSRQVYDKLSDFQKENTFILFNKNSPEIPLGFILFVPANTIKSTTPRILSWKLTYCFGHYYFTDIFRRIGTEILWEGINGPKEPIDIKKELGNFQQ